MALPKASADAVLAQAGQSARKACFARLCGRPRRLEAPRTQRKWPSQRRKPVSPRKPSRSEVERFIGASFRSVWAIELLCLLRRNLGKNLTHAEMVAGLRASDLVVSQSVETLAAAGLVLLGEEGGACYGPASATLDHLCTAAEALYVRSPDAVRRTIVSAASPGLTAFADAFRLRGD
jgi:hypothetical protein